MLKQIEQLNKEARMLNSQREQMIGKKEMAEKAYNDIVKEYSINYGVNITANNIDDEYAKVEKDVKDSIEQLKSNILAIKTGEYRNKVDVELVAKDSVGVEVIPQAEKKVVVDDIKVEPVINLNVESVKVGVSTTKDVEESKEIEKPALDEGFKVDANVWGSNGANINDKFKDMLGGSEFQL